MGAMTSLSNRDCAALLRDWGFNEVGYNGGHLVMERAGRKVQITAPSRSTPTPYKALRKAARILGVSLQEFLAGPKQEKKKMPEAIAIRPIEITKEDSMVSALEEIDAPDMDEPATSEFVCPTCGKAGFTTKHGFNGHLRSHERVVCTMCHKEYSRQGIGPHMSACGDRPKKRGPGRPRHPIAEELAETGRKRKDTIGVEVPILDDFDDEFPDVAAFLPIETEQTLLEDAGYVEPEANPDASLVAAFEAVLPGITMTPARFESFKTWVEAARVLFKA